MFPVTKFLNVLTACLLIVGGLNWGLIGIFNLNLIGSLFGEMSALSRILYIFVGLSAVYEIAMFKAVSACWLAPFRTPHPAAH
ncbi:MAG: DUF378 domain-containing protein [Planctomycetota bacterium]|nr:DUF378 domain-containing protein [Planctomycetota bacterium]